MSDLDFQQFSPTQSRAMKLPTTIASAASITPTTRFTRLTGTTPVTTIVPPVTGYHELVFVFTSAYATALNTGGNIAAAITSVADRPITVYYDPRTALYYPMTVA
jgi:hypothetical protein